MNTFLDLLVIFTMALIAVGALAAGLMFLVKNEKVKNISFGLISALGIYMGYVGVRIMRWGFPGQTLIAVVMALVSVGAIILAALAKGDKKKMFAARIMACAAFAAGFLNAMS